MLKKYVEDGYSADMLDKISYIFTYVDMIREFSPVFMRFDFPQNMTSTHNVENFFKRLKKNHTSRNRKIFFMYTFEQKEGSNHLHAYAFCIVDRRDYRFRRSVKAMLQKTWDYEQEQNPDLKNLWISTAPPGRRGNVKGYNFYSLSTHENAHTAIDEAFKAASYLAKLTQIPKAGMLPAGARRWRCSEMPRLSQKEIRPGFDPEKNTRVYPPPTKSRVRCT
jgi:hypothetical protein